MKTRTISMGVVLCLCSMPSKAAHYDFEVDGIRYTINKRMEGTCAVAPKTYGFSTFSEYKDNIIIPKTVVYNECVYTVTAIERDAFWASDITSVSIPITVETIGGSAFSGCFKLTDVYNHATVPQEIDMTTFNAMIQTIRLHVYEGYKDVYANANSWANFVIQDDIEINKVRSITLNKDYCFCSPYHSSNLTAVIEPSDASIQALKWESSNDNIAYVTDEGKVIGVKEGTAIITVLAKDGSGVYSQCKVEVAPLGGVVSDYNEHLSSSTTTISAVGIGSYYRETVGFYIENSGPDCIYLTKVVCKNPNTLVEMSTITSKDMLGWVADGERKYLQASFDIDIIPVYEFHYLYKDVEFVFNSNDDNKVGIDYHSNPSNEVIDMFDLSGKRINTLQKGINIIRYKDGATRKIITQQ